MNTHLKSSAEVPQPKLSLDTPELRILPVAQLIPHELPDQQRSVPLVNSLQKDAILKNPPVVAQLDSNEESFMVLDGANRVTAFQELDFPHILVQVVPYEHPYVELHTWYHAVSGVSAHQLEANLSSLVDLETDEANILHARAELARRAVLAYCLFASGKVITLAGGGLALEPRTRLLHNIVEAYIHNAKVNRTNTDHLDQLLQTYPEMIAAVIFPQFEPVEVMDITQTGLKLPTGLTRHIIHGRALRLNYPLDRLVSPTSLDTKNAELADWVRDRFSQRRVRFYSESTFLFDE